MEELEAVKLDILEAGRKHGLREILLQSIAKLLEKGKSKEEICELLDVSEKDVDKAKKWQRLLISSEKNGNKVTIRELFESDELWEICKSKNEEIQVKRIEDCKNFDENAFPAEGEYMDADTGEFEEEIAILKKRI